MLRVHLQASALQLLVAAASSLVEQLGVRELLSVSRSSRLPRLRWRQRPEPRQPESISL